MHRTLDAVTVRVMQTYALMYGDDTAEAARGRIVSLIESLSEEGETDDHRLAVSALAQLRDGVG